MGYCSSAERTDCCKERNGKPFVLQEGNSLWISKTFDVLVPTVICHDDRLRRLQEINQENYVLDEALIPGEP